MVDSEKNFKKNFETVVKEIKKKEQIINCKNTECFVASKRGNLRYELHIGNVQGWIISFWGSQINEITVSPLHVATF